MPEQLEHQPANTKTDAPAWLAGDPCPSWCEGDHPAEEHPDDRSHLAVAHVPVVRAVRRPADDGAATSEAAEYVVVMRRYIGETETWVYIGEGEDNRHAVEVTAESARRLVAMAAKLIEKAFT